MPARVSSSPPETDGRAKKRRKGGAGRPCGVPWFAFVAVDFAVTYGSWLCGYPHRLGILRGIFREIWQDDLQRIRVSGNQDLKKRALPRISWETLIGAGRVRVTTPPCLSVQEVRPRVTSCRVNYEVVEPTADAEGKEGEGALRIAARKNVLRG